MCYQEEHPLSVSLQLYFIEPRVVAPKLWYMILIFQFVLPTRIALLEFIDEVGALLAREDFIPLFVLRALKRHKHVVDISPSLMYSVDLLKYLWDIWLMSRLWFHTTEETLAEVRSLEGPLQ
jgi:hypothetical protein